MPHNPRTKIDKYVDADVAANGADNTLIGQNPIPNGRTFKLTCFGGSLGAAGRIMLQLKTGPGASGWTTIRCVEGPGTAHFERLPTVVGDGTAALRIRRVNDTGTAQPMCAWIEGIRRRE